MFKMEVQNRIRIDQNAQSIHNSNKIRCVSIISLLFMVITWTTRFFSLVGSCTEHREQSYWKSMEFPSFFPLFFPWWVTLSTIRASDSVCSARLSEKRTQKEEEDISEIFISGEEAKNTQQQQNSTPRHEIPHRVELWLSRFSCRQACV